MKYSSLLYLFGFLICAGYFIVVLGREALFPEIAFSKALESAYPGIWKIEGYTKKEDSYKFNSLRMTLPDGVQLVLEDVIVEGTHFICKKGLLVLELNSIKEHKSFLAPFRIKIDHLEVLCKGQSYVYDNIESNTIFGGGISFKGVGLEGEYWNAKCFRFYQTK